MSTSTSRCRRRRACVTSPVPGWQRNREGSVSSRNASSSPAEARWGTVVVTLQILPSRAIVWCGDTAARQKGLAGSNSTSRWPLENSCSSDRSSLFGGAFPTACGDLRFSIGRSRPQRSASGWAFPSTPLPGGCKSTPRREASRRLPPGESVRHEPRWRRALRGKHATPARSGLPRARLPRRRVGIGSQGNIRRVGCRRCCPRIPRARGSSVDG
jgi:hypothetical protein